MKKKKISPRQRYHLIKPKDERKKTPYKVDLIKALLVLVIIGLTIALLYNPLTKLLNAEHRIELKMKILEAGLPAHAIYVLAVAIQVILSFIPTTGSLTFLGGFAFGPVLGTAYTTAGIMLGSTLAFYLGRRYGRPVLEDWIDQELLKKFDEKSEKKGLITLLLIFLIPFTPDNAVCLVAGTTKMRIRNMVMVAAIGRLPGTIITTMVGAGLGATFSPGTIITITLMCLLIGAAYIKRVELEDWLKHLFEK